MRVRENLVGQKRYRLTVLEMLNNDSPEVQKYKETERSKYIKCLCECGNTKVTKASAFKSGECKSCGCLLSEMVYKQLKKYCTYDLESSNDYGIGYTSEDERFIFDKEDYELIKKYNWRYHHNYLTSPNIPKNELFNTKQILLHRLVLKCSNKEREVDHINHNTYDNRKVNLREVRKNENMQNKVVCKNNKSGTTGVYAIKYKKHYYWRAQIGYNAQQLYLGTYTTKEDAIKARKEAEEKYFGEYSLEKSINRNREVDVNGK